MSPHEVNTHKFDLKAPPMRLKSSWTPLSKWVFSQIAGDNQLKSSSMGPVVVWTKIIAHWSLFIQVGFPSKWTQHHWIHIYIYDNFQNSLDQAKPPTTLLYWSVTQHIVWNKSGHSQNFTLFCPKPQNPHINDHSSKMPHLIFKIKCKIDGLHLCYADLAHKMFQTERLHFCIKNSKFDFEPPLPKVSVQHDYFFNTLGIFANNTETLHMSLKSISREHLSTAT